MCVCILRQGKTSKIHPCHVTSLGQEKSACGKAKQMEWDVFVILNTIVY